MNNRLNKPLCSGIGKKPKEITAQPVSIFIPKLGYPIYYLGRGVCPDCGRKMSFRAEDNPTNNPKTGMSVHLPKDK